MRSAAWFCVLRHADARCFVIPGITHHARNNLADTVPQAINALGTDEGDKGYSQGNRIYYRSQAFWQVSASVNLPGAANRTTDAGLNGFDSRCCAYGVAIAVLTEMKFPDAEGNATLEYPEGYTSRRS